jgi:hypothetical protein
LSVCFLYLRSAAENELATSWRNWSENCFKLSLHKIQAPFDRIDALVEAFDLGQHGIKAGVKSLLQLVKQFFYVVLIQPRCPKDREDEHDNSNSGGDDCDIRTHTLESLTEAHTSPTAAVENNL